MLKKSRSEILTNLDNMLSHNLSHICTLDGSYQYMNNDYTIWNTDYTSIDGNGISVPPTAVGWPPEIASFIKRVAMATAIAILDEIYDEKEMEERVDDIVLGGDDANNVSP